MIRSTLTGGNTRLIKEIATKDIVASYRHLDVSHYFTGLEKISLLECLDTGYRFYHPLNTAGDSRYYEFMSKDVRYYMPWKWEYDMGLQEIKSGDKVLEIGCGTGDVIARAGERGAKCIGLELNERTAAACRGRGLDVKNVLIEEYAKTGEKDFDVVCAFQVLEHIPDVKSFISSSVSMLKKGGKLVVGVPNNASFIKKDPFSQRNMPPHHMGLWDGGSLRMMAPYFGLSFEKALIEPLQKYHYRYLYNLYLGNDMLKLSLLGKILNKLFYMLIFRPFLSLFSRNIVGMTIVAIYKKN